MTSKQGRQAQREGPQPSTGAEGLYAFAFFKERARKRI